MSFIEDEDSNWAHRLYKVRNVIVHSQNKLNDKDLDELVMLNAVLLSVCVDMICHFQINP